MEFTPIKYTATGAKAGDIYHIGNFLTCGGDGFIFYTDKINARGLGGNAAPPMILKIYDEINYKKTIKVYTELENKYPKCNLDFVLCMDDEFVETFNANELREYISPFVTNKSYKRCMDKVEWYDKNFPHIKFRGIVVEKLEEFPALIFKNLQMSMRMDLAIQCLQGIQVLHHMGFAHTDIKPENFLYRTEPDGSVQVIVADLDRLCNRKFIPCLYNGTPAYTPPDISFQEFVPFEKAKKGDLYALGVTLYEIATGISIWPRFAPLFVPGAKKDQWVRTITTELRQDTTRPKRFNDAIQILLLAHLVDTPANDMLDKSLEVMGERVRGP